MLTILPLNHHYNPPCIYVHHKCALPSDHRSSIKPFQSSSNRVIISCYPKRVVAFIIAATLFTSLVAADSTFFPTIGETLQTMDLQWAAVFMFFLLFNVLFSYSGMTMSWDGRLISNRKVRRPTVQWWTWWEKTLMRMRAWIFSWAWVHWKYLYSCTGITMSCIR